VAIGGRQLYESDVHPLWTLAMHEYEIRILGSAGSPALIIPDIQLSDEAAIRSARKIAGGRPFEVWRGLERIAGPSGHQPGTEQPSTHQSSANQSSANQPGTNQSG
jgi:hypothetical protein